MRTKTINLAVPEDLLNEVDKVAQDEYRTRSELLREALRRYVLRKQFITLTASLQKQAKDKGFKPEDVDRIVAADRRARK